MQLKKKFSFSSWQWFAVGSSSALIVTLMGFGAWTISSSKFSSFSASSQPQPKLLPIIQNNKVGYIDKTGKVVISPKFEMTDRYGAYRFSDGLSSVFMNNKWGYIDETGKMVINPQFDHALPFFEGLALVSSQERINYIDKTGKIIFTIPPEQKDDVERFSEGLAPIQMGDRWGFIDRSGKIAINPQFEGVWRFSEGLALIRSGEKFGFIDRSGKIIINPQFENAANFSQGLAPVKSGDKLGFINKVGKLVINYQFDELLPSRDDEVMPFKEHKTWIGFSQGLTPVRLGKLWGYLDKDGKFAITPQFDEARGFSEGLAAVRFGERWGFIDKSGKVVINPQFSHAKDFTQGLAFVSDQQIGYISKNGQFVWSVVDPNFVAPEDLAKQSEAKQYVGSMNRAQQAFYLENSRFSSDLSSLGLGISQETENYSYNITVVGQARARNTAIPKRSSLKSYIGGVAVVSLGSNEITTIAILCESNQPSKTSPPAPILAGNSLQCAPGSKPLN